MTKEELVEVLAAIEYERWAKWQESLFLKCMKAIKKLEPKKTTSKNLIEKSLRRDNWGIIPNSMVFTEYKIVKKRKGREFILSLPAKEELI